ncbi:type VI secretion system tip protein VgrG [Apibacter muscae]|nr:type VI secretion system tip protein VgrG [Apibacter muscae]
MSHKIPTYGGSKSNLFENSSLVSVKILINGKESFNQTHVKLEIKQSVFKNHEFKLWCDPDEFEENKAYLLENSRKILGKRISFIFYQFGKAQQIFTGIVSRVSSGMNEGVKKIVLTGACPSVLMENGAHCESFENRTLEEIMNGIASHYPQNLVQFRINANFKDKISYVSQYNESDYSFIRRLAAQFGEYFYYDGEQFVFSAWGSKIVELMEGEDIYDYDLSMQMGAQAFGLTGYDPQQGESLVVESSSKRVQYSENPFQQYANNVSEDLYASHIPTAHYGHSNLREGRMALDMDLERGIRKKRELVRLEARGNNPSLRVGDIAKLKVWMPGHQIFKNGKVPAESYKVLEIVHSFEDGLGYEHRFVGVPKDSVVPACYNSRSFPRADVQHAVVTQNQDPQKMGRVRVQFTWQKAKNSQTPWVQIIQPHAGSGKGTYFTPEVGETVLVAFQGGNPDAPVVLGTAYNGGEIARYYTEGNDLKVIETRSGTKIVFNDAEGKGSILVEDPSGNRWFMDGKGSISVDAPKDFSVTAGENINLSAGKNMNFSAGQNQTTSVGMNATTQVGMQYSLFAGDIDMDSVGSVNMKSKELQELSEEYQSSTETTTNFHAQETFHNNSGEKSNLF